MFAPMAQTFGEMMLATRYPVSRVQRLLRAGDTDGLATFFVHRLSERYIEPVTASKTNGFAKAALACLLLETLECFRRGEGETPERQSAAYFRASLANHEGFLDLAREEKQAAEATRAALNHENEARTAQGKPRLRVHPDDPTIYANIRCGILHQGETTRGWRLTPKVARFDWQIQWLNAHWFHAETARAVDAYANQLRALPFEDVAWRNFCAKLDFTIEHTRRASAMREPEN